MNQKYDYSSVYIEKNPYVKYRRCKYCKKRVSVKDLEIKSTCQVCYTIVYDKKRCIKCNIRKLVKFFTKNINYNDGYCSKCDDCRPNSKYNSELQKKYNNTLKDRKSGKTEPKKISSKSHKSSELYTKKSKERRKFIDGLLSKTKDFRKKRKEGCRAASHRRHKLTSKGTLNG